MKRAMLIALCVLLTACGGGGDDEDDTRKWDPLNCQTHPEKCK